MKKCLFYLIAASFVCGLYSCQKEFELIDTHENIDTTGNNPGPVVVTPVSDSNYQPLLKGSYWKYKDSASGEISIHTSLGTTTTINGKVYTPFLAIDGAGGADTVFYSHDNISYYVYTREQADSLAGMPAFLFNYYNDTLAIDKILPFKVGQEAGVTISGKTKILSRNTSLTVNNQSYTNVVHTLVEVSYDIAGTSLPAFIFEFYAAKGVGLIKARTTDVVSGGGVINSSELVEYSIK